MKKQLAFLILMCGITYPAQSQFYSPKQIEKIQDDYFGQENTSVAFPDDFPDRSKDVHKNQSRNTLRDTLLFKGKSVLITDSPLLYFPKIDTVAIRRKASLVGVFHKQPLTLLDAERCYTALWGIENDSLFLYRVSPYVCVNLIRGVLASSEEIVSCLENVTGQRFIGGKLFAGWVNEQVVGGVNGIYLKRRLSESNIKNLEKWNLTPAEKQMKEYTGHYLYSEEYTFYVENGIVKQVDHQVKK